MTEGLPEDLEDAVLAILEGDDDARDAAIGELLRRHPAHAATIRDWLVAAGAIEGDWHGATAANDDAGNPAEGPDGDPVRAAGDHSLPQRVGDYVLHEVIGRGGFGTVYRAEQVERIHRFVAIKVLNPGMDSREILARFRAEQKALNRMDHPGIARLLDAGSTAKGHPFFVMELVEGPPMLTWCRRQMLSMHERIALFLKVCDAMQHAHQKSVLHRDLSSNNVLVATNGTEIQPKIIDFGIAKSLADPLLQGGAMTFQGTFMGTPEFMSPEQAAGRSDDIDTRADVYSLGVQLYELLADQLPIPGVVLRAQGIAKLASVIADHTPPPPSAVAPRPRQTVLKGDLDHIVMKAIAKERHHRYAGVGELAADLNRYLADEPITIAAPSTWYRLRKFVRRNRAQSTMLAAAMLAICTTLVFLMLALRRANHEATLRQQAMQALQKKADAGFRLLANFDLLEQARQAELELPPPWPRHRAALDGWLDRFATPLAAARDRLRQRLDRLERRREQVGGRLTDESDRHLLHALRRLDEELDRFLQGPARLVNERLAWCETVLAGRPHADDWRRAREAIKASDGETAHAEYAGLVIPDLPGLRPIGCHPRTKLWEFLDLRTHPLTAPIPARDTGTGDLLVAADTGIVFALLPPGRIAIGARRNQPGMERNDQSAAADELNDDSIALEAFLIARTELTGAQWARLTANPGPPPSEGLPATNIDLQTARQELHRFGLQLPTEAQWEYACRAGTTTPWSGTADPDEVARFGWFDGILHRCGGLRSNAFGLFDMHGNAAEWCRDAKLGYAGVPARAGDGLRTLATTPADAAIVVRGGSSQDRLVDGRATARGRRRRDARDGFLGFRPVRRLRAR